MIPAQCITMINLLISLLGPTYIYVSAQEYQYDDSALNEIVAARGVRLVGAKSVHIDDFPFSVAWYPNLLDDPEQLCSGSIIHPQWFITVSHCYIAFRENRHEGEEVCTAATKENGFYEEESRKYKCTKFGKDVNAYVIEPLDIQPSAFIGVSDINSGMTGMEKKFKVKYIVKHLYSYKGDEDLASAEEYGGYDLALAKLDKPVDTQRQRVCLPGPMFNDIRESSVLGYGSYNRDKTKCLTLSKGPMKYHYCKEKDNIQDICDMKNPAPTTNICQKFFSANNTPNSVPENLDEIIILNTASAESENITVLKENLVYCYNNASGESHTGGQPNGWCKVDENHYSPGKKSFNIPTGLDWGFCSGDCFLDDENSGKLRMGNKIDVLDEETCDKYLRGSFSSNEPNVSMTIWPYVLCSGTTRQWNYGIWIQTENGFKELDSNTAAMYKKEKIHFGQIKDEIVTSPGVCNGDSGGPLLVEEEKGTFVLTGLVSRGRGVLGACGGINNPVHMTRVKMFSSWILGIVGAQDVCWDEEFTSILDMDEEIKKKRASGDKCTPPADRRQ